MSQDLYKRLNSRGLSSGGGITLPLSAVSPQSSSSTKSQTNEYPLPLDEIKIDEDKKKISTFNKANTNKKNMLIVFICCFGTSLLVLLREKIMHDDITFTFDSSRKNMEINNEKSVVSQKSWGDWFDDLRNKNIMIGEDEVIPIEEHVKNIENAEDVLTETKLSKITNSKELTDAVIQDSQDPGPKNGERGDLVVEADEISASTLTLDNLDTNLDWDEMLAKAPSRKSQILKEWGITKDLKFYSFNEFKTLIGDQCPSLRHCSIKQRFDMFLKGGDWLKKEGSNEDYQFHPYDCWLYNFDGNEPWTRHAQKINERLVIFIDGGSSSSKIFKEASKMSEIFKYLEADIPLNLESENQLSEKLENIIKEIADTPSNISLTLVTNWVRFEKEPVNVQIMQRFSASLRVKRIEIIWANQPYDFEKLGITQNIVKINEYTNREIKKVSKETVLGSRFTKRMPVKLWMRNPNQFQKGPSLLINPTKLFNNAENYVLYDVRMEYKPFIAEHLEWFFKHGHNLPLLKLQNGWTPNVALDTKIVVYCQTGMNANKAVRLLRLYGYLNAQALSLNTVRKRDIALVSNGQKEIVPKYLQQNISIFGIDLFAPSIAAITDGIDTTGNTSRAVNTDLISTFLSNYVLNIVYKNEIVSSAPRLYNQDKTNHVCQYKGMCTSCFKVTGSIRSSSINFALIKVYLIQRAVPVKIILTKEHKIWEGSWIDFMNHNKNSLVTVRKNYSTVRTRKFEKQKLPDYLVDSKIVKRVDATGEYLQSNEQLKPNADGTLPIYAGNNKLDKFSMEDFDFKYPEWIRRNSLQRPAMWLGPKGSLSSLHVDHSNRGNLAYQVLGKKKWHLMPPSSRPFLYGRKVGVVIWSILIDPDLYNEEKEKELPLFKYGLCDSIKIEVDAGEMLFNPDEWWHVVYNDVPSLMLNFWIKATLPLLPPKPENENPLSSLN